MKASLEMSTKGVKIIRLQNLCDICELWPTVLLSRPLSNIDWFKLEDQNTRIRLHFQSGYDEQGKLLSEAEYYLHVDDPSDMEFIIWLLPGSTVKSVWYGGLWYKELTEILSCTLREYMQRKGYETTEVCFAHYFLPEWSISSAVINLLLPSYYFAQYEIKTPSITHHQR